MTLNIGLNLRWTLALNSKPPKQTKETWRAIRGLLHRLLDWWTTAQWYRDNLNSGMFTKHRAGVPTCSSASRVLPPGWESMERYCQFTMKMGGIQEKKVLDEVAGAEMMWWTFVASSSFSVSTPASFRQTDLWARVFEIKQAFLCRFDLNSWLNNKHSGYLGRLQVCVFVCDCAGEGW